MERLRLILAILQARYSSSRLPGKILKPIREKPMILHQIERIKKSKLINNLILATSTDKSDDELAQVCEKNNICCFRGSLDNVLERFYEAAKICPSKHIVRLTGDCPLIDPEIIDSVIDDHLKGDYDYTSNTLNPSFPDGLDVEIFKHKVLEKVYKEARLNSEKEHVTSYIYKNPDKFNIHSYEQIKDYSHLRWTVDNEEDFVLISRIYEILYTNKPDFKTSDILNILENNPDLIKINSHIKRNEGYKNSILKDN